LAADRITVNGFCPGIVATELWRKLDKQIMGTGRTSKEGEGGCLVEQAQEEVLARLREIVISSAANGSAD
jgi:NAD(P)-dependent dehydrogenase (short-subunit alcohol dehydrogenase family)